MRRGSPPLADSQIGGVECVELAYDRIDVADYNIAPDGPSWIVDQSPFIQTHNVRRILWHACATLPETRL